MPLIRNYAETHGNASQRRLRQALDSRRFCWYDGRCGACGLAAQKCGTGLITAAIPESVNSILECKADRADDSSAKKPLGFDMP